VDPIDINDPITRSVMMPKTDDCCSHFTQALQIPFPFYVDKAALDSNKYKYDINITYHKKAIFCCPRCGEKSLRVHRKLQEFGGI
jgi:hypothetical protein